MSDLTLCNYCNHEWLKARCKEEGKTIELRRPDDEEMASLMQWAAVIDGEEVAWYMDLTDHCVC